MTGPSSGASPAVPRPRRTAGVEALPGAGTALHVVAVEPGVGQVAGERRGHADGQPHAERLQRRQPRQQRPQQRHRPRHGGPRARAPRPPRLRVPARSRPLERPPPLLCAGQRDGQGGDPGKGRVEGASASHLFTESAGEIKPLNTGFLVLARKELLYSGQADQSAASAQTRFFHSFIPKLLLIGSKLHSFLSLVTIPPSIGY